MDKRPRVIPVLGLINEELVKTLKFKSPKYIGDPINAIKIFNEKEVDELVVLDIRASLSKKNLDFGFLRQLAGEAFMPLGYGGGIKNFDIAKQVFDCGIEKVVLNTAAYTNPALITELAKKYGSQSVCISVDYKKTLFGQLRPTYLSGSKDIKKSILEWCTRMQDLGAGEIILQNVDKDGTFKGFDISTADTVSENIDVPIISLGGASSYDNLQDVLQLQNMSAVAASSIFIFQNGDRDSILISYK